MTREEAKEWLPIIQAWAEGKTIQYQINPGSRWSDIINDLYTSNPPSNYRIKPQPKYRPFKTQEECWQEMQKHQPFGWIKDKNDGHYSMVTTVDAVEGGKHISISGDNIWSLDGTMSTFTFADGTPFGIKEDF
ncbi:MAG: hypothetical protein PUF47_04390 [Prevotella stercorea]|nr:hypothetical protein [Leyella stercorea]